MNGTTTPRLGLAATFGLMAGPFLSMVDSNIVTVAVPAIARDLQSSLAAVQWTLSAYLLAMGAALAAIPYLAKRFGTRPLYMVSIGAFTLASLACALSPAIGVLIAARVLQGAAGAPLVPLAMSMLMGRSGASRQMSPVAGILLFMAPAAGPTIGGLLIPAFGWPSIFLVNLPFGLLGILGSLRIDARLAPPRQRGVGFDPIGLVLLSAGVTFTLYGASQGPSHGWFSPQVWPFWLTGIVLVAAYIWWAVRREHPAINLKLLGEFQPALAVGLSVITSAVLFAALFLVPVFMQSIQGQSPLTAGLALLPQGVVLGLATIAGNQLVGKTSLRLVVISGMVLLAASTGGLLVLSVDTPAWLVALILAGRGLAMGFVITPLVVGTLGMVRQEEAADANTLFNVVQRIAGSFGIGLLATLLQARERMHVGAVVSRLGIPENVLSSSGSSAVTLPPAIRRQLADAAVAGFHDVFLIMAVVSLVGVGLAFLMRDGTAGAVARPVPAASGVGD